MKPESTIRALGLTVACLLAACGGEPAGEPVGAGLPGAPATTALQPSPRLAARTELGTGVATAATLRSGPGHGALPLEQVGDAIPGPGMAPISNADPAQVLGRSAANPYQPRNNSAARLLPEFEGKAVPTGKWSKGFFYQSPSNLDAWFQARPGAPGAPADPRNVIDAQNYSVYAFPNKLWLDDRISMVSVAFPKGRRIALDPNPDSVIYDLRNPYVADYVPYSVVPDSSQDARFNFLADGAQRLPRRVDRYDELTVSTSWMNAAGTQGMQLVAAEGSPYVTLRYAGVRPVVQVGQGILARRAKDADNNDIPGSEDYAQWESDNQIVAVAVDEQPSQVFVERGPLAARATPSLSGTRFRFTYLMASEAQRAPGSNDNVPPPATPLVFREMVLYASQALTLDWNPELRSYVARAGFQGVLRAALVDDVAATPELPATAVTDLPQFRARRQVLDRHAMTYPVYAEVQMDYDGGSQAQLHYEWGMQRMDGATPDPAGLLMMGFDATHIPSLRAAQPVDLHYRSNFGRMSAVAGASWTQDLAIPGILRSGASADSLWFGPRAIKPADAELLRSSLRQDAALLQNYIAHCNYESYQCGKYLNNVARLVLIADQLGEHAIRVQLLDFLRQSINPWFDGADPNDPTYENNPIKDYFLYDVSNRGVITRRGLNSFDGDFYNAAYTDHMFHYGYFLYAAAVLSRYDAGWHAQYREKVNTLARDIANPSRDDPWFPLARTFDWYRLQNLADAGPDFNGANTESSSEAIHSGYALLLWGVVSGNSQLQALAAVMSAAEIRSAQAFYQVTPHNSLFQDLPAPSVTVKLPGGASGTRLLAPAQEPTMGIIWQGLTQSSVFFGTRQDYKLGIQLLPISPISDYVISRSWAAAHGENLLAQEQRNRELFDAIIQTPPNRDSACFQAGYDSAHPPRDANGQPLAPNPGATCTTPLRTLYGWRHLLSAVNALNDPHAAWQRFNASLARLPQDEESYRRNTDPALHPGASLNAGGVVSDVLKDVSTPSTNTNTLWWLSMQKP